MYVCVCDTHEYVCVCVTHISMYVCVGGCCAVRARAGAGGGSRDEVDFVCACA